MNSHYHPETNPQVYECPSGRCLNNEAAANSVEETFNYPARSNLFYQYRHRHCEPIWDEDTQTWIRTNTTECGTNFELSEFDLCPSWLEWETWGNCFQKAMIEDPREDDPNAFYHTFERKRVRTCNTGTKILYKIEYKLTFYLAFITMFR